MQTTVPNASSDTRIQPTAPGMRIMLYVASALVFAIGIPLYLFTERTDEYFAWTIGVPLTAAFLGGGYWASFVLEFLSAREREWARGRIAVPAVLTFTTLTLIVTLIHIDRFHFNVPAFNTLLVTWVWLIVYAVVPVIMTVLLFVQRQTPGGDPARVEPMPGWVRGVITVQSLMMLVPGVIFLFAPTALAGLWPWELTPLTARAIGAWLIGLGIAAGHSVLENEWVRVRPIMVSCIVFGVLQLIALARYPNAAGLDWSLPRTWVYVIFIVSLLLVGIYGTIESGRVLANKGGQ